MPVGLASKFSPNTQGYEKQLFLTLELKLNQIVQNYIYQAERAPDSELANLYRRNKSNIWGVSFQTLWKRSYMEIKYAKSICVHSEHLIGLIIVFIQLYVLLWFDTYINLIFLHVCSPINSDLINLKIFSFVQSLYVFPSFQNSETLSIDR